MQLLFFRGIPCPPVARSAIGSASFGRATRQRPGNSGSATFSAWSAWPASACAARHAAPPTRKMSPSVPSTASAAAPRRRFPQLLDRDNLWPLLVIITARKASRLVKHECRQKRGSGAVLDEAALDDRAGFPRTQSPLEHVMGREPTPEFAAQVAEECRHLLGPLGDPQLKAISPLKMEGYANEEVSQKLGCALRTVERKLQLIRGIWEQQDAR
jgi:DNA-directed RNA polymerase specialized sigma24 family protein